jgi:hypothetical protein
LIPGACEDVHLGWEQAEKVVDVSRRPGKFRLAPEMVEHIAVHAAQVEEIINIVEWPARDDREDAHVVAIVERAPIRQQIAAARPRCARRLAQSLTR